MRHVNGFGGIVVATCHEWAGMRPGEVFACVGPTSLWLETVPA
jgi:hypothetical protein